MMAREDGTRQQARDRPDPEEGTVTCGEMRSDETGGAMAEQRDSAGERVAELLVFGFGTSVSMWFVGYLGRLPGVAISSALLGSVLLACLLVGGFAAGRFGTLGVSGAAKAGLVAAAINLLVLGSLLSGGDPSRAKVTAALWIPGSFAGAAILCGLGGLLGVSGRTAPPVARNWPWWFAVVTGAATILLLIVGGVVTSHKAGLAVVDWPNSFGTNMFLFPLSRMTGGVYYEHAHRLFGSLVGLTTVAMAVVIHLCDRRRWLRMFSLAAVAAVIAQGILGGLRVTGTFTLATDAARTAPSVLLAVVHGVFGQVFFGMIVGTAVFLSATYRSEADPVLRPNAGTDRALSAVLTVVLLVQLILGAQQRHLEQGLLVHVSFATIVVLLALASGARAAGLHASIPALRSTGIVLSVLVGLQAVLGISAAAAISVEPGSTGPAAWQVSLRAAHQGTGALLLASAVTLSIWSRRLLTSR
jgi:cytochrome c oxidase assembly protein subunit 15